jgi:glutamine---fructose-6-phosphate transaminase (isomerizing)
MRLVITDTARDLAALQKNRKTYEKTIRATHWTEGPITIVGSGASRVAGLGAARAFEWLLGWPVAVRDIAEFSGYTLPALQPRSVLIAVSPSGEEADLLEAVRKAQRQGATALALTRSPENSLGRVVRDVFLLPCAEEAPPAVRTTFLEHATLIDLALIAASVFNPRHPLAGSWEAEFTSLPSRLEWIQEHLGNAIESGAAVIGEARQAVLTGGGFYQPAAQQGARLARQLLKKPFQHFELADVMESPPAGMSETDVAIILSGSNCRVKRHIHAAAAQLREKNVQILAVSDGNDRQLVQASHLVILLPVLSEVAGSLLTLAVAQWLVAEG